MREILAQKKFYEEQIDQYMLKFSAMFNEKKTKILELQQEIEQIRVLNNPNAARL